MACSCAVACGASSSNSASYLGQLQSFSTCEDLNFFALHMAGGARADHYDLDPKYVAALNERRDQLDC